MSAPAPTLFDLEPVKREPVYTRSDAPFVPFNDQQCGFCRRKLRNCSTVHGCGRGDVNGWYWVCDDCATEDPHWGISREYLEIDRLRRSVYAADGGETEVQAAIKAMNRGAA